MKFRSGASADANAFSAEWAPKLLRFFYLYTGDQKAAESLTIETLVEQTGGRHLSPSETAVALLSCAVAKAASAPASERVSAERVVHAVSSLPPEQKVAIVLFRGLSLDLPVVARILHLELGAVKRLCASALLAIQISLADFGNHHSSGEPIFRGERR